MEIVSSITGIVYLEFPNQGLEDIKTAGFKNVLLDLSIYCPGHKLRSFETKLKPEQIKQDFDKFIKGVQTKNLQVTTALLPYLLRDTKRTDLNELLLCIGKDCIKMLENIGCKHIIARPLYIGVPFDKEWEINKAYYLELAKECKNKDTMILLQNQCKDVNGHLVRGVCSDEKIAVKWIDELNKEVGSERFGFCLDVGVCNICGQNMQDMIVTLGERVKTILISDNNGIVEQTLLPFTSRSSDSSITDWLSLIRGLRQVKFDGQLVADCADTSKNFSPILRPQLIALSKSIMDYFKWQIELETSLKKYQSIVLFGAGNMCRNFMKCYGEQYKPLFTCDNNSSIWGTKFCGLEVKNPEELKDLPKDCGVYICNMYYREIEQQLKDLGVENIEFFNDEYLSSYYEDRLKRRQ